MKQRQRKRPGSAYEDKKYDGAFTIANAMSDYEDDPQVVPGQPKRYIAHAPDWRSEALARLYADIDARPDPNPDLGKKIAEQKSGVAMTGPPREARTRKGRVQSWMVKKEILEANAHWVGKRVHGSGTAWGEEKKLSDDEEEKKTNSKRGGAQANEAAPTKKRRVRKQTGDGNDIPAEEELEKMFS
ncbi:hypothetical protein V5O48_017638 [Marasmius crinis-equi]|uniref:Uncharacterized protein n=1 Tax=Marasmius crinis-equi TaxID=585013 RepID=A0ABR3ENF2_9AGAR